MAELLAMSLWFSATAVAPLLAEDWGLSSGQLAWLTMAVQLGFVAGALVSALLNLADVFPPRMVFAGGAVLGATLNGAIPLLQDGFATALLLRFGTGASLAAVYPVGMKIMATWTRSDRGLGLGILVGALTLGSASPHLISGLRMIRSWEPVMLAVSLMAVAGGVMVLAYGELGPYRAPRPRFRWREMGVAFRDRSLRLANFGYLGHMWELYAMWTWIPLFLIEALPSRKSASVVAFLVIGVGAVSSVLAGRLADRWGRSRTTILSLAISGACALSIGAALHVHVYLVVAIALVWGFAVVADSAQYSAAVSELAPPEYMGTILTTQTAAGFLLTLATIRMIPLLAEQAGWGVAMASLAVGPAFGIWAMSRLIADC